MLNGTQLLDQALLFNEVHHKSCRTLDKPLSTPFSEVLSPEMHERYLQLKVQLHEAHLKLIDQMGLERDANWHVVRDAVNRRAGFANLDLGGVDDDLFELAMHLPLGTHIVSCGPQASMTEEPTVADET